MPQDRAQYHRDYYHKRKVDNIAMREELERLRSKKAVDHQACDAEIAKLKAELRSARELIDQYRRTAW